MSSMITQAKNSLVRMKKTDFFMHTQYHLPYVEVFRASSIYSNIFLFVFVGFH